MSKGMRNNCSKSFEIEVIASNAAALFPSPRFPREGIHGEGNKAAALEAIEATASP